MNQRKFDKVVERNTTAYFKRVWPATGVFVENNKVVGLDNVIVELCQESALDFCDLYFRRLPEINARFDKLERRLARLEGKRK